MRHSNLLRKEYELRLSAPKDTNSITSLKKQLAAAEKSVTRLIDAFADGVLDRSEFDPRSERARRRVEKLKAKWSELENDSREKASLREALACVDDFTASVGDNLSSADWSVGREILRTLIDRVEIESDRIRIVYRINFPLFAKKASKGGKARSLHFRWRSRISVARQRGPEQAGLVPARKRPLR